MKFTQRLAYYLGGFSIGLILLFFFLSGKNASCDYGPNARTVKNISSKPFIYSEQVKTFNRNHQLDSATVRNLIRYGNVDFSQSQTKLDSCNIYRIENSYKDINYALSVQNCDSLVTIISMNKL